MQEIGVAWQALKYGGAMVYPLLALGVLAIAIIIDRARALLAMPAAARGSSRTWSRRSDFRGPSWRSS